MPSYDQQRAPVNHRQIDHMAAPTAAPLHDLDIKIDSPAIA
jgi:hypothetical protein